MAFAKKIVLATMLANLLISVYGAPVQRDNVEEVTPNMEAKSGIFKHGQSYEYRFGKFKRPQRMAEHPTPSPSTLNSRNNFGDFLEMCGQNQVMIEGRCENITL